MTDSPFAAPAAPSAGISWADFKGCLLLIEPTTFKQGVQTSYGTADAVQANVVVLDGPHAGTEIPDTLIFPKILVSQTQSRVGQKVLGRLGQGQAKQGQSPPWMLSEATPEDQELGMRWLNRTTQPAPAAAPAEPQQQAQDGRVPF